jgi:predicted nucleotidyltransferase component of viral defense system
LIAPKFVDLYARNAGLRDKLIAERDVVLTYALRALLDEGVMDHLAFKGGTCLRKIFFGSSGRFSEDLDFTIASELSEDDTSFGGDVLYRHDWNDGGRFRLQVSLRERPTLPPAAQPLQPQGYFAQLEFEPFAVRALAPIEVIAEKVRASYQRAKVRDLYDLYRFAPTPFDGELLRRLARSGWNDVLAGRLREEARSLFRRHPRRER